MFTFDIPAGLQAIANPHGWWLNALLVAALAALTWFAYRRPAAGVAGVAASLPLYLARARLAGLPTTFLELAILLVGGATLLSTWRTRSYRRGPPDPLRAPATALIAAGTLALLWSPNLPAAAGLWRAYLVEPALLYALARFAVTEERDRRRVVLALTASAAAVALLALWQQATGIGIAEPQWVPLEGRRVTAHYTSPNAVGLYLGPILALTAGLLLSSWRRWRLALAAAAVLSLGLAAVWFTRSAGTWLGLAAAALTLMWFTLGRRWAIAATVACLIALAAVPVARQRIAAELTDPAWGNRRALWAGSLAYLTSSPKNFLLGAGIHGFNPVQDTFRNPRTMEPLLYPHAIALNFWMEYGLLGLAAAAWLGARAVRLGAASVRRAPDGITLGALAALAAMLAHGLVDVPYFKNDLAALTWLLLALLSFPPASPPPWSSQPTAHRTRTLTVPQKNLGGRALHTKTRASSC